MTLPSGRTENMSQTPVWRQMNQLKACGAVEVYHVWWAGCVRCAQSDMVCCLMRWRLAATFLSCCSYSFMPSIYLELDPQRYIATLKELLERCRADPNSPAGSQICALVNLRVRAPA